MFSTKKKTEAQYKGRYKTAMVHIKIALILPILVLTKVDTNSFKDGNQDGSSQETGSDHEGQFQNSSSSGAASEGNFPQNSAQKADDINYDTKAHYGGADVVYDNLNGGYGSHGGGSGSPGSDYDHAYPGMGGQFSQGSFTSYTGGVNSLNNAYVNARQHNVNSKSRLSNRIVSTRYGKLQGFLIPMDQHKFLRPVEVFLGVPYATPPIGSNR